MTEQVVYEVTELTTHKDKYVDEYEEILYGDDYVKHSFKSRDEANACAEALKAQGIATNVTEVHHCVM